MNKPDISVIIPLYNKEAIIERSVQSVLNQSFANFELIIVNDGSTDNSFEIVKSIQDKRIVLINQPNGGPSKARNTGIKAANSDWIVFLDADDELLPEALMLFWEASAKNPTCDIFCGEVLSRKGGTIFTSVHYKEGIDKNIFKKYVLGRINQCSGSTMYKRSLCLRCLYDEQLRRYEDLDCLFRKYHYSDVYFIASPVACINVDYAAASTARRSIKEDFLGHLDFSGKSFWEYMALYQFYLGEREYYPREVRQLYPNLHRRYDVLILYKIILLLKKLYVFA